MPKFDLVTLTFHENSNHGQDNDWKSGVQIPNLEGQKNFVLSSFHFQFVYTKLSTVKLGNKEQLDKEQMNHFLWPICHLLHKNKEHLPLRNNFRVTKSSLFPCSTVSLILTIFWYLVLLFRNQLKQQVENVFFINIWFVKQDIPKYKDILKQRFRAGIRTPDFQ